MVELRARRMGRVVFVPLYRASSEGVRFRGPRCGES